MKNLSNQTFFSFILLIVVSLSACSNEPILPDDSYNFIDQNALGKINGTDFELGEGTYGLLFEDLAISLYHKDELLGTNACNNSTLEFGDVFFTIPNEVGLQELQLNIFDFGLGKSVVFNHPDAEEVIVGSFGAIEILSISDDVVEGRIDARADEDNFINGNFTVSLCE